MLNGIAPSVFHLRLTESSVELVRRTFIQSEALNEITF
jgi:hypothetical protein